MFAWINQSNKGIYKVKCQKGYSMFIKTMNIELLGIFQCEYHPRCCNYCTSIMFSLLGLITSKVSLTNHPKVRTNGTFWRSECSSLQMLQGMNSVVGERIKSKAKWDLVLINQRWTRPLISIKKKSPRSMGLKLQIHYSLSCTMFNANLVNFILIYPATLWCIWRSNFLWIKPRKSYGTHWTNP